MSNLALRAEALGKRFHIGRSQRRSSTLREAIASRARRPFRKRHDRDSEVLWALRDVSFEVSHGEVLGIVGRNGAGKSTLLKILSRITPPTSGRAEIWGRVGSLLEVGTGFHAELTGRENIFLNGAILGMRRAETSRKFDEIVAFAEIDRFLDTPVKHYSSGMYMRLAFAVAAHLEPEILLVDEVLAVGDAAFQKKCLGKMDEVSRNGRTILFVSHNMAAVQRLCTRCVLLEAGRLTRSGTAADVVGYYLSEAIPPSYVKEDAGLLQPAFVAARLEDSTGAPLEYALSSAPMDLAVSWRVPSFSPQLRVGIGINSAGGQRVFGSAPEDSGLPTPSGPGLYSARVTIPANLLLAGHYAVALCLWAPEGIQDYPDPAFSFRVEAGPSPAYRADSTREGLVQVLCPWEIASA